MTTQVQVCLKCDMENTFASTGVRLNSTVFTVSEQDRVVTRKKKYAVKLMKLYHRFERGYEIPSAKKICNQQY